LATLKPHKAKIPDFLRINRQVAGGGRRGLQSPGRRLLTLLEEGCQPFIILPLIYYAVTGLATLIRLAHNPYLCHPFI